jgi:hypothetical protein
MLNVIINENFNGKGQIDKCLKYLCILLYNEIDNTCEKINKPNITTKNIIEYSKDKGYLKINTDTDTPYFIGQRAKLLVEYYYYKNQSNILKKRINENINRIQK